jgi:IS5 family transposase
MNQTRQTLSSIWNHFQNNLFPILQDELGTLTERQKKLVQVIDIAQVDRYFPYRGRTPGRPQSNRAAIARAFIAKAIYDFPTTETLLEHLKTSPSLRRICGWEKLNNIPDSSTFSRAFAEFAGSELAQKIHADVIENLLKDQLIGHISRDSTAINAREKPEKYVKKVTEKKKRGRPKKGEERPKVLTRLEKQSAGMTLEAMLEDLPDACRVGTKRNSKGYKTSWTGYKLHIDAGDSGIPISCVLTSASLHDSQVAIPLAEMTAQRVTNCYDLMDAAYDSPLIKKHSESLGHVALIDENPRSKARKAEIESEQKSNRKAGLILPESLRYNERSTVERVNGRLKDEFGGRHVRVKGASKVMSHLMFGILALTIDQLMRLQV